MKKNQQSENATETNINEAEMNASNHQNQHTELSDSPAPDKLQPSTAPEPSNGTDVKNYLEQLQRLQAEFANYRKRIEREKLELSNFYKSELVSSLLPIIDDFERMLNHANDNNNELLTGVRLIFQKFMDILQTQGLKPIVAVGQKFDPAIHEALVVEQTDNGDDEVVVEEWQKGYFFNDRLIRPAQVKVSKNEVIRESKQCPNETTTTY